VVLWYCGIGFFLRRSAVRNPVMEDDNVSITARWRSRFGSSTEDDSFGGHRRSVVMEQIANNNARSKMLENLSHGVHRYAIGKMNQERHQYTRHMVRTKAKLESVKKHGDFLKKKHLHVSSGGHIARALMDPMDPHFKLLKPPRYIYPLASLPQGDGKIVNPDWDHYFINAECLQPDDTNSETVKDEADAQGSVASSSSGGKQHHNDLSSVCSASSATSTLFEQSMGAYSSNHVKYARSPSPASRVSTASSKLPDISPTRHHHKKNHGHHKGKMSGDDSSKFLHTTYLFLPKLARKVASMNAFPASNSAKHHIDYIDEAYIPDPVHRSGHKRSSPSSSVTSSKQQPTNREAVKTPSSIYKWESMSGKATSSGKMLTHVDRAKDKEEHPDIFENMLTYWKELIVNFQSVIHYNFSVAASSGDYLYEICKMREPPPMLIAIIGYICLLVGMEPTWAVARKTVLKEVGAFRRLLSTISPAQIQLAYAINAVKFKNEFMAEWDDREAGQVSKSIESILRLVSY
jgi:hypothetical protein